jgi:hypothetical protein
MVGNVVNIKVCISLKLRIGLTRKCNAIGHYTCNLLLGLIVKNVGITFNPS